MEEPERPARAPSRRAWWLALSLLAGGCCVAGVGVLSLRDVVATALARSSLAAHGVSCDEDFALSVESGLAHASLAPCTCTLEDGAIASFELVDPVSLDLDGTRVTHVRTGTVSVVMRPEGPAIDAGVLGPIASVMGVPARIGGLIGAAADVARLDPPAIDVPHLDVVRDGRPAVSVESLALDAARPIGVTAARASLPGLAGPLGAHADLTIEHVTGTTSSEEVRLEGDLTLTGSAPLLGEVSRAGRVVLRGEALGSSHATYQIELP